MAAFTVNRYPGCMFNKAAAQKVFAVVFIKQPGAAK